MNEHVQCGVAERAVVAIVVVQWYSGVRAAFVGGGGGCEAGPAGGDGRSADGGGTSSTQLHLHSRHKGINTFNTLSTPQQH